MKPRQFHSFTIAVLLYSLGWPCEYTPLLYGVSPLLCSALHLRFEGLATVRRIVRYFPAARRHPYAVWVWQLSVVRHKRQATTASVPVSQITTIARFSEHTCCL